MFVITVKSVTKKKKKQKFYLIYWGVNLILSGQNLIPGKQNIV